MSIAPALLSSHNLSSGSGSRYAGPNISSSRRSEPNLTSLFERYDHIWDKDRKTYKKFKSSENPNRASAREPPNKHEGTAFYLLQSFDEKNHKNFDTELIITSKHLCEVMNIILPEKMPDVVTYQSKLNPHILYHYLDDFRNFDFSLGMSAKQALDDPRLSRIHLAALIYFLETEYEYDRVSAETLLALDPPHITFDLLWLIFKPGTLVLESGKYPRLYRGGVNCIYSETLRPLYSNKYITLHFEYVAFDGEVEGFVRKYFKNYQFEGVKKVTELSAFPFEFYTPRERAAMEMFLEERGRKYINICQKGRQYVCLVEGDKDSPKGDGRLVIDAKTYAAENDLAPERIEVLEAIHYQLCSCYLWGFMVVDQCWETVHMDEITDIIWKEEMLVNVVLEPATKTMIKGLVSCHNPTDPKGFKDIIPGKGVGLVMLFSGPPGVGKTLTAVFSYPIRSIFPADWLQEAVAEATHRPIYRISANDLGCEPMVLEENLARILKYGEQFGIILLLDEADVFLEQRTSFDVKRNSLVSVFLRELEYFRGILILTTNRVDTFDRALESRIHFNLRFPEMNRASRRQLWEFFLKDKSDDISYRDIYQLAEFKLNGRMIKHAVSLGLGLAKIQNESLSFTHISASLKFIDPSLSIEPSAKPHDHEVAASPMDPAMTPWQPVDFLGANMASPGEFIHPAAVLGRQGESIEQNGFEAGRGSKRARHS